MYFLKVFMRGFEVFFLSFTEIAINILQVLELQGEFFFTLCKIESVDI